MAYLETTLKCHRHTETRHLFGHPVRVEEMQHFCYRARPHCPRPLRPPHPAHPQLRLPLLHLLEPEVSGQITTASVNSHRPRGQQSTSARRRPGSPSAVHAQERALGAGGNTANGQQHGAFRGQRILTWFPLRLKLIPADVSSVTLQTEASAAEASNSGLCHGVVFFSWPWTLWISSSFRHFPGLPPSWLWHTRPFRLCSCSQPQSSPWDLTAEEAGASAPSPDLFQPAGEQTSLSGWTSDIICVAQCKTKMWGYLFKNQE
ncbi:uncharacterized protein LOC133081771 [Eubalaena glacialis]|uniref:uncharacterized protein LOC133081771 n=1 Tax=Eubalaena glacialis TaxID=27606 RepID=UPI002A5A994F|nr:uncharacterized protein LOC133081771 [Eubalaena glacialis]